MKMFHRLACTAVVVALLALGTTTCPPSVGQPTPGQPSSARPTPTPNRPPLGGGRTGAMIGGGGFLGRPAGRRPPTAAEITRNVQRAIEANPGKAFDLLRQPDARVLSESARQSLGREAVQKLSLKVELGVSASANLAEVRTARKNAAAMTAEIRTSLEQLTAQTERAVLAAGIIEVSVRAERGKWGESAEKASAFLDTLSESRLPEQSQQTAEFRIRRTETCEALAEVVDAGKRIEAIEAFTAALKALAVAPPGESARKLGGLASKLSPQMKRQAEALRGLAELKALATQKWTSPPNVAEIKASVKGLEYVLTEIPDVPANLGRQMLQDLAVKAFLDGHAPEYFKLMPTEGPAERATQLLRDMKAMALGEGKVETWPAGQSVLVEPGKSPIDTRPPPGLAPLLPEGVRTRWRPPAKAALPPLGQTAAVEQAVKAKVEARLDSELTELVAKAGAAQRKLTGVYQRVIAPEQAERRKFAEFEAELDRRLRPIERVQVRGLVAQNQSQQQIVKALQSHLDDDDEGEFLRNVAKHLGKPLTADQRGQAQRLRRAGRTASEVADILRT